MKSIDDELDYRPVKAVFDKYTRPGATAGGPLTEKPAVRPVTVMGSGEIRTFADGQPMEQYVLTVQTDERDPQDADDDGARRIYVKGHNKKRFRDAVRAAGLKTLSAGDVVRVKYVREEPIPGSSFTTKIHEYSISPGPNAVRLGEKASASTASAAGGKALDDEPPF